MARTRYTDEQKADALALYVEHGPAETARRTGIAKGTLASWAHRAGVQSVATELTAAATEAASAKWAERRQTMVDEIGLVAEAALSGAAGAVLAGRPRDAKDYATTMAILVDKAQLLGGDATTRHENRELRDRLLEETRENARHLRSVA
jgi:transposase-like protein